MGHTLTPVRGGPRLHRVLRLGHVSRTAKDSVLTPQYRLHPSMSVQRYLCLLLFTLFPRWRRCRTAPCSSATCGCTAGATWSPKVGASVVRLCGSAHVGNACAKTCEVRVATCCSATCRRAGTATGGSKKDAKHNAAAACLDSLLAGGVVQPAELLMMLMAAPPAGGAGGGGGAAAGAAAGAGGGAMPSTPAMEQTAAIMATGLFPRYECKGRSEKRRGCYRGMLQVMAGC